MNDRILDRYGTRTDGKNLNGSNGNAFADEQEVDDLGTFGFLRGSRERATMLELRKKDGSILAVAYGYMDKAEFDPSDGITLHLAGQKIRIKGRNLNVEATPKVKLFEGIARHRVPWIQEAGEHAQLGTSPTATIIDVIQW